MNAMRLLFAMLFVSCQCGPRPPVLVPCETDGGCLELGQSCHADGYCHDPDPDGGGTGGGAGGCSCTADEVCADGQCFPKSCGAVTCSVGCENGACRDLACLGVICSAGQACVNGACVNTACSNMTKDGTETDVDCGPDCPNRCADGQSCEEHTDCTSNRCVGQRCAAASCMDNAADQDESDVDCGGTDGGCPRCADGKRCGAGSDCASRVCDASGRCAAPTCTDLAQNAKETDVDCGGGTCPTCPNGQRCDAGTDCSGGLCTTGICGMPACTIAARQYVHHAKNPANDCQWCEEGSTATAWSNVMMGTACTATDGKSGICRGQPTPTCCTGCWNGSACLSGDTAVGCGLGGGACRTCMCSNDTCPAGACVAQPGVTRAVAAGPEHSCRLELGGGISCWGYNNYTGNLGQGNLMNYFVPTRVGSLSDWAFVGVQGNSQGGNTSFTDRNQPMTCGLRAGDGGQNLWCWGGNSYGQLGIGSSTNASLPQPVGNPDEWLSIAPGGIHACGIKVGGSLWCWGRGMFLGFASGGSSTPARVGTDTDWVQVAAVSAQYNNSGAGGDASLGQTCAIKTDHSLWCWGTAIDALGLGGGSPAVTPQRVSTTSDWAQVAVGGQFAYASSFNTCAIKTNGTLWCWGSNTGGECAQGTSYPSPGFNTPVPVGSDTDWKQVSVGNSHVCAVKTSGQLWCWGWNGAGQLGIDGGNMAYPTRQRVGSDTDWESVAAGGTHTCAVKRDHTLWCWGFGQLLGRGASQPQAKVPVRVCQ